MEEQFSFDPDVLSLPDNADVGRSLCKHAQRLPETPTAEKPPKRLIKQHSMKSPSGTKKPVYTIIPNLTLSQQKRSPRSGSTSSTTSAEEQIYDAKMIENQALAGLAQLLKNKSLKVGSFLPVIAPPAQTQLSQPQPMQCFGSFRRDLSPLSWLEGLQGSQLFYSEEPQGKGASGVSSQRRVGVGRGGDKAKPLTINPAAVVGQPRRKLEADVTSPEIPKQDTTFHLNDGLAIGPTVRKKGAVPEATALLGQQKEPKREKPEDGLIVSIARTTWEKTEGMQVGDGVDSSPSKTSEETLTASESQQLEDFESSLLEAPRSEEKRPRAEAENETLPCHAAGQCLVVAEPQTCESLKIGCVVKSQQFKKELLSRESQIPSFDRTPAMKGPTPVTSPTIVTMFTLPGARASSVTGAPTNTASLSTGDQPQSGVPIPIVLERNQAAQLTSPSLSNQDDASLVCPTTTDPHSGTTIGTLLPAESSSNLVTQTQPESPFHEANTLCGEHQRTSQLDSPQFDDSPLKFPKSPAIQRITESCGSSPNGDGSPHRWSPLKDIPMRHLQLKLKPVREMPLRKRRLSMEQGEPLLEESEAQLEQGELPLVEGEPQLEKDGLTLEKSGHELEKRARHEYEECLPKRRRLVQPSGTEVMDEDLVYRSAACTDVKPKQKQDDVVEKVERKSVHTTGGVSAMDVGGSIMEPTEQDWGNAAAVTVRQSQQEMGVHSGDPDVRAPSAVISDQLDVAELLTMLQETIPSPLVSTMAAVEGMLSLQDAEIAAASQILEKVHTPSVPHQVPDLQMVLEAALMDMNVESEPQLVQKAVVNEGRCDRAETLGEGEVLSSGFEECTAAGNDACLQELSAADTARGSPTINSARSNPSSKDCMTTVAVQPISRLQVSMATGTRIDGRRLSAEALPCAPDRGTGLTDVPFPQFQTSIPNQDGPTKPGNSLGPDECEPMKVEQESTKEILSLSSECMPGAMETKAQQSIICPGTQDKTESESSKVLEAISSKVGAQALEEVVAAVGKEDEGISTHTTTPAAVKKEEVESEVGAPVGGRRKRGRKKKIAEKEITQEDVAEETSRPEGVLESTSTVDKAEGSHLPEVSTESESGPKSLIRDMTLNFSEPKTKGKTMLFPSPGQESSVLESSKSPMSDVSTPSTVQPGSVKSTKSAKSKRLCSLAPSLKLKVSIPLTLVQITHHTVIECYVPSNFAPGDIVWAKGNLLPAWPGRVISHKDRRKDKLKAAPTGQVSKHTSIYSQSIACRQTRRQTDMQTDRQAYRQTGRQTDRQAYRQTGRQADR